MDKVHALLLEQLNRENERAKRELLEQQSACNIARKQREDAGIRLYGMQKQVARVQTNMELMNNEREQLLTSRESKETALRESESISIKYRAEHEKLRENVANKKAQLIDLRESLRYMQQSDLELLGEIKKNQLTVSKGNDGSKTLERDKRMCNSYIEHLTENLRSKQDEEQALHLQIEAQQHQTEVEKEILRQILTDVDRLVIEKSNLIQEWKLSLSAIKARDEALGAATSAWKRFQLEIRDSESRLKELQKEISRVQGKNSDLSGEKKQLENVVKSMDRAIETIQREKEMNEGVQDIIRQNLKRIKQDEDIASKEIRTLCNKMDSVNKKIESVLYERHNLEKEVATQKYDHVTLSAAAKKSIREIKNYLKETQEKEMEAALIQNDIAKRKIERLNGQNAVIQLEKNLDELKNDLISMENTAAQCESEILRQNIVIDKKNVHIKRFDLQYKKILDETDEPEPIGPLNSTFKSLTSEIERELFREKQMQDEWMSCQTKLMQEMSDVEAFQAKTKELNVCLGILKQKKNRVGQQIHSFDTEQKFLLSCTQNLVSDKSRLDRLVEKYSRLSEELSKTGSISRQQKMLELEELQSKYCELGRQIDCYRNQIRALKDENIAMESEVMHLDKKNQLEKETQLMIKKSDEVTDTKEMQKALSRMKVKLEKLRRDENVLVQQMQQALLKRDSIATKYNHAERYSTVI